MSTENSLPSVENAEDLRAVEAFCVEFSLALDAYEANVKLTQEVLEQRLLGFENNIKAVMRQHDQ